MPTQRTLRRQALVGAGTTGSLLVATIGGALVVAGLLGFGALPEGPEGGSTAPLRVASIPARERAGAAIVVPRVAAPRPLHHRTSARAPAPRHKRQPRRPAVAPSRTPSKGAGSTVGALEHTTSPNGQSAPAAPAAAAPAPPPRTPAPSGPLAPAADGVRTATQTAAGAVQPAAPQAADAVAAAGETAAGAVEQLGSAIDATLSDLGGR
jgi:hypothetical protein